MNLLLNLSNKILIDRIGQIIIPQGELIRDQRQELSNVATIAGEISAAILG